MVWVEEKKQVSFHITRLAKDSGIHVWVVRKGRDETENVDFEILNSY